MVCTLLPLFKSSLSKRKPCRLASLPAAEFFWGCIRHYSMFTIAAPDLYAHLQSHWCYSGNGRLNFQLIFSVVVMHFEVIFDSDLFWMSSGVKNVVALRNVIVSQKLDYDFKYHQLEFQTDIPVLILSEGKSFLPVSKKIAYSHE